ncbi:hypothetical protein IC575_015902 [Cucumis melo]
MADRLNSTTTEQPNDNSSADQTSKYKSVRRRKWGKWVSEIRLPNSRDRIWLGSYDKPEKAARAFDAAQFCLRGPQAKFNFPDSPPEIDGGDRLSAREIQAAAAKYAEEHGEEGVGNDHDEALVTVEGGGVWPDWDMTMDGGWEFGFGGNAMIYDGNISFEVQENMEEKEDFDNNGGDHFCHEPNFLWNFDNH